MPKSWIIIGIVALLLIMLLGASLLPKQVTVQAVRIEQAVVREFIDERGKTRLPKTHDITMPLEGRVEMIKLSAGDEVAAGQVVARLVSQDLNDAIAEAQSVVERVAAAIRQNDDTSIEEKTRAQAEQMVASMQRTLDAAREREIAGKERLDKAETFLGRVKKLRGSGTSEVELEQAELEYVQSQSSYRQDVLVAQALSAMYAATELLPKIVDDQIDRKELSRAVLEREKNEAEARLRMMLTRRDRGQMVSPVDGVILQRAVHSEQHLPAGALLARIGDLRELEIEVDVLSRDATRIHVGSAVEIYDASRGDAEETVIPGVVAKVHPQGFTKISSLGVEQQRVKVIVEFSQGIETVLGHYQLGVDYRVRCRIITREKSNVLRVPRTAMFRGPDGAWNVFRIVEGKAVRQPIQVGLINADAAEVLNGLAEGAQIVLLPESDLADGVHVRVTN